MTGYEPGIFQLPAYCTTTELKPRSDLRNLYVKMQWNRKISNWMRFHMLNKTTLSNVVYLAHMNEHLLQLKQILGKFFSPPIYIGNCRQRV